MSCDVPYFEMIAGRPAIYSPVQARNNQLPPSEGYKETIGWRELLRMNSPTTPPVARFGDKQVLAGKMATTDSLAEEFHSLVKQWNEETFYISSLSKIFSHPAYVRIMAMGTEGLPLVLGELQKRQGNWFYALKFMAGEKGKGVAAGIKNYEDARAAWLEWGYNHNYI